MKKTKPVLRRKRPKSVLRKAWETRRAKAKTMQGMTVEQAQQALNKIRTKQLNQASSIPPSKTQGIPVTAGEVSQRYRDEQLCGFLADMVAARNMARSNHGNVGHFPILVTRSQTEAIEEWLREHGYSPFGKGSGSLMSVSTNPSAKAA